MRSGVGLEKPAKLAVPLEATAVSKTCRQQRRSAGWLKTLLWCFAVTFGKAALASHPASSSGVKKSAEEDPDGQEGLKHPKILGFC